MGRSSSFGAWLAFALTGLALKSTGNGSHWQLGSRAALVNHGHHRVVAAGRFHLCQSSPCVQVGRVGFLGLFVLLLEAIVGGLGIFIVRVVGVLRLVILLGLVFVQ